MNWKPLVTAVVMSASPALAQVKVEVGIPLPTIRFEVPPPVVVVQPGVRVVEDYDYDVFVVDGWYWYCDGHHWYRARDHHGGWAVVEPRYVPTRIVEIPRGKYKHFKGPRAEPVKYWKGDDKGGKWEGGGNGRWKGGGNKWKGGGHGKHK